MIISGTSYVATGQDRAAASVCLVLAAPFGPIPGGARRPQHDARFAGAPVASTPVASTPVTGLRRSGGESPAMKIDNFEFQPVPGSTFWRPPA